MNCQWSVHRAETVIQAPLYDIYNDIYNLRGRQGTGQVYKYWSYELVFILESVTHSNKPGALQSSGGHHVFPFTSHGSTAMRGPRASLLIKWVEFGPAASFRQSSMRCNYFNLKRNTSFTNKYHSSKRNRPKTRPETMSKICRPFLRTCCHHHNYALFWLYALLTGLTHTLWDQASNSYLAAGCKIPTKEATIWPKVALKGPWKIKWRCGRSLLSAYCLICDHPHSRVEPLLLLAAYFSCALDEVF